MNNISESGSRFKHPRGHVFYRRLHHERPMIDHGKGVYLFDTEGRRYLDGSGGALVVNVGHGREEIIQAITAQAAQAAYVHASMFTSESLETYAAELAQIVPIADARFFFVSSGSEAIEAAIKLARQIQVSRGESERRLLISHSMSYHGTTLGALGITGRWAPRSTYQQMMSRASFIPSPNPYRNPATAGQLAANLQAKIEELGSHKVAAYIAEPVSGASLGATEFPPGYWPLARQICNRYGVLFIADEVLVGFGRCGRWWALEHEETIPDILVASKGITSGYFPLGFAATAASNVDLIHQKLGDFNHGGTFSHHAVGAAAGLATLRLLRNEKLVESSHLKGDMLGKALRQALGEHPHVGDIRGCGLFWALEIVADRRSKVPFPAASGVAAHLSRRAFELGLIVYHTQGCADGTNGDLILLGPPFIIEPTQISDLVERLRQAIAIVFGS